MQKQAYLYKQRVICLNPTSLQFQKMSTPQQKAARSQKHAKVEDYYLDSPEEVDPNPQHQQYKQLGDLCQKEILKLHHTHLREPRDREKQEKSSKQTESKVKNEQPPKDMKESVEEISSSQYQPDSQPESLEYNEDSYEPSEKLDNQSQKQLNLLIRKFSNQLFNQQTRGKKIKDIAECLELEVDTVKNQVAAYFQRQRSGKSDSSRLQHQTIYKKTEMFDDAIRKVLKATPYACINDLREEIKQKLDLDLAKETLIRRLKNLKYHYKKFAITKPEKNDQQTIQLRKAYIKIYKDISTKEYPFLFYGTVHMALDECRGSMWMKSKENGQLDHTLCQKDVVNIVLILSSERIEFFRIYQGFYKYEIFLNALNRWLSSIDNNLQAGSNGPKKRQISVPPAYLAIQNNLIHNSDGGMPKEVKELLLSRSVLPIPFPGYSSSMNPADVLFNQIKYVARGKVKRISIQQLHECIQSVIQNNIDLQDIRFAFRKVQEVNKKY